MQTKVRTGICKPAKTTVTQMPDPESDVFKYTLAQSLSPHGTNVLCYRNNAIGLFGEKIGPKFAGGGIFCIFATSGHYAGCSDTGMKTQLTSFGSTARHLVGRCFSYPPEAESHSFFFIDQRVEPSLEAKLHRHAARELYYIVQRDDLFAVRHAIPLEYGPRAAEAFTKTSIGIRYTVGFNDLPHFVRVFTKNIGMPPSQYRKSCNRMRTGRIHSAS